MSTTPFQTTKTNPLSTTIKLTTNNPTTKTNTIKSPTNEVTTKASLSSTIKGNLKKFIK
jgi:hypothetical protein